MIFNSIQFALFLPVVFLLYWFVAKKSLKYQNFLLLFASYFFYACWDWRFLFLLFSSTLIGFITGWQIDKTEKKSVKKFWLWLSIAINIGFLGVFKYYNFFIDSFIDAAGLLGYAIHANSLNIVLPVGISFYTFHSLSYFIDVYFKKISSEKSFVDYGVFVSFFPLMVAGPIERATHLLPQVKKSRSFNYEKAVDGLKQILWGLFKKVVIADNCAEYVNVVFDNPSDHSGSSLLLGALLYTVQIYGDFSGYSDIALGTARLFGIELLKNFNYPYFSRDIGEFWRRWHISLSSWFRDYVYIPLGGSRGGDYIVSRNIFIVFVLSGFWHGANWTFITWGAIHAFIYLFYMFLKLNKRHPDVVAAGRLLPTFSEWIQMSITFILVVLARIFFRADSMSEAFAYFGQTFSSSLFSIPEVFNPKFYIIIPLVIFFFVMEWLGRTDNYAIEMTGMGWNKAYKIGFYYMLIAIIFICAGKEQQFIYYQF